MADKHTPGPWKIGTPPPNGEQTVGTDQGLMVAVATTGAGVRTKANASLIAAAPDLLEALRKYELPIDINNIALSCIEFGSEAVERELQRRAAIAKATGEPQ